MLSIKREATTTMMMDMCMDMAMCNFSRALLRNL